MKNFIKPNLFLLLIGLLIFSCTTNQKQKQLDDISGLEKEIYSSETFNKEKGRQLLDLYIGFSDEYPSDSLAASYVYKGAEIAMNLQLSSRCILYFDRVISQYPDYKKVPECLFLKAFVYENQMNNIDEAGKLYSEFIEKYPTHPLANDAEASIKYLGKSPEELVKLFQELNEE